MDYQDREAKAMEILNAPEPAAPAEIPAAPEGAAGGAAEVAAGRPDLPAAGAAGGVPVPSGGDTARPAAAVEARAVQPAPPPVQPTASADAVPLWSGAQPVAVNELQQLMTSSNIGDIDQLKGTLADAGALYQVLDGRQTAAALLDSIRLNYPPQTFFRILGEVQNYVQRFIPPAGFQAAPGMAGASPAAAGNGNGNGAGAADGGLGLRLTQLENTFQAQQRQAEFQAQQQQQQAGFQKFMARIRELGQKEGLDEDDIGNYAAAVAQRINGDPQITGRLIQGKLNDIDRLFTEHHNSMLQWENRRNQRRLEQKQQKNDTQPRIATGGGPPAPIKPGKQDMSFEGRTARAMELLKQ